MNHGTPGKELPVLTHPMIPAVRAVELEGLCMTCQYTAKGNMPSRINYFLW